MIRGENLTHKQQISPQRRQQILKSIPINRLEVIKIAGVVILNHPVLAEEEVRDKLADSKLKDLKAALEEVVAMENLEIAETADTEAVEATESSEDAEKAALEAVVVTENSEDAEMAVSEEAVGVTRTTSEGVQEENTKRTTPNSVEVVEVIVAVAALQPTSTVGENSAKEVVSAEVVAVEVTSMRTLAKTTTSTVVTSLA